MALSASEAAFEGFRIARERPMALVAWSLFYLVISLISSAAMVTFIGETMAQMTAAQVTPTDPEELAAMFEDMGKLYGIAGPIGLISTAVLSAAVYRVVLRPEDKGLQYLKLGWDEVRLILLNVVYVFLLVGLILGLALAIGLLVGITTAINKTLGGFVALLGGAGVLAAFVYVMVRLSLAAPMTFTDQRLRIFDSWKITRGRFWSLFGAYFLAVVMAVVVSLLGYVIIAFIALALGGGMDGLQQMMRPDFSDLSSYFTPVMMVYIALGAILSTLAATIINAAPAVVLRELREEGAA